jgi:glycosyltransferase involved in cell wall biosynthesis
VLVSGRDPLHTSGGTESYAVGHARAAILAGYEPHIFSVACRSEVLETDFGFLHRVRSPVRPPRSIHSVLQRPWLVPAIVRFLRSRRPDPHVIHGYGAWADIALASARGLRTTGVRSIPIATAFVAIAEEAAAKLASRIVQAEQPWGALYRIELAWVRHITATIEGRAYRSLPVVLVNYESVRAQLEAAYGPGLRIRRITYSPPTALHDPPPPAPLPAPLEGFGDPGAPLIVSVSRHDGRKGIDVLIDALASLRAAGVRFRACLVGPGLLLEAHRRLIGSLGLDDQVLVPGRVEEVMPYLLRADVYVLPSLQEGSGSLALLEALQAGAAIVASAIDGIVEDVHDGRDALLVAPGDPRALREAIARVLSDEELRASLRAGARETFKARFTLQANARELAGLYAELGLLP